MFKNRHVVAALIIAPILSIISYFAVDYVVAEQPHKAIPGMAYELEAKPNCRYQSGVCEMKNGNFEISIRAERLENNELKVRVLSAHRLQGVGISISDSHGDQTEPTHMAPADSSQQEWAVTFEAPASQLKEQSQLRIALSANESLYYAESGLAFVQYETAYHKDFR